MYSNVSNRGAYIYGTANAQALRAYRGNSVSPT